jgi:hypothetical protein
MPRDVSQYDDRRELAEYLWHNYPELFSDGEKLAERTLLAEQKMTSPTMSESMKQVMQSRWIARGETEVERLLANGASEFKIRAAERLMKTHASELFVNRCSSCDRIVATPRAKQCLWCGHDWHGELNGI